MIGNRVLPLVTRTLDAQEQAIGFIGFPTNLSVHVQFIDAFLISAKPVAIRQR